VDDIMTKNIPMRKFLIYFTVYCNAFLGMILTLWLLWSLMNTTEKEFIRSGLVARYGYGYRDSDGNLHRSYDYDTVRLYPASGENNSQRDKKGLSTAGKLCLLFFCVLLWTNVFVLQKESKCYLTREKAKR